MKYEIKASVIIPTFNRLKYLCPCLICLFNQETTFFWEIIIIDSGDDETQSFISQLKFFYGKYLVYKSIKKGTNRAKLRNIGASLAKGEVLIFLDNDILVDKNFVQTHYMLSISNNNSIILGKRRLLSEFISEKTIKDVVMYHYDLLNELSWTMDPRDIFFGVGKSDFDENLNQWRFLYSHNFSIKKNIFIELNGFDEIFGNNWGYEDIELGFRHSIYNNRKSFILSDEITGYHLPHIEQTKKSIKEGFENFEIFHNIHNCYEIELNVAFCLDFDFYYNILHKIKNSESYKVEHIFEQSDFITCGYLWSKEDRKNCTNKKYFGICLPFIKDNSFPIMQIINSFFLFPNEIKHSILREALRITNDKILLEDNKSINLTKEIKDISKNCGYIVKVKHENDVYEIQKIKRVFSNYYCVYLPDCFESKKRFYYLLLSLYLIENNYFVKLVDTKYKENISNENYRLTLTEIESLNLLFRKDYGSVDFQSLLSIEKADFFEKIPIGNKLIINDSPFDEELQQTKTNDKRAFNFSILEAVIVHYIRKSRDSEKSIIRNILQPIVLVSIDDGFIEDNVENILEAFYNLPNYKLILKLPDYEKLAFTKYIQDDDASKYNKSFSMLVKYEMDELKINQLITKFNLENQVQIIKSNYCISEYVQLLNRVDIFMDVSKGKNPSPLVYYSLLKNKRVIIGNHIILNQLLKDNCITVPSIRSRIIDKFNLPYEIENYLSFCFTCNSKDIEKVLKNIDKQKVKTTNWQKIFDINNVNLSELVNCFRNQTLQS